MSSPRREWWSLRCSRRCAVRSLMRWVSSATWTRVLPVSCWFAPNRATISAFCSWVSVVMSGAHGSRGTARVRGLAGGDLAGLVDVAAHLLDKRLDRLEALLAAQPLEELDAQVAAVQVAVVVEQVGLDQLAATGDKHRPYADIRGRRVRPPVGGGGAARVHAVAGRHVALGRDEVRGREAQLAAALVALDDLAGDRERRAEQPVGVLDRPAEDQAADVAGGHDLAVDLEQRDDAHLEAPVCAQQRRVALRPVAEAEVLPHAHVRRPQRAGQHLVEEALRAAHGELGVERHHDELLDAEAGHELGLALERRQQQRRARRGDDRHRMGVERQHGVRAADDLAVAEVHAVEGPDGHAPRAWLDVGQARDPHARNPTMGFSCAPGRGSAIAMGPSASTSSTSPGAPSGGSPTTAWPWAARRAASPSSAIRGRNPSAVPSGSTRAGSASATSNGPTRVRRSSSVYASPRSAIRLRTYVPDEHSMRKPARSSSRQSCSKRYTVTSRSGSSSASPSRARS